MAPEGNARNLFRRPGLETVAEAELEARDEDARLMLAFCDGDARAFDALFERWAARLLRYLERMLRDRGVAEELTQETFFRVHRSRDRYRVEARFSTWLYRIATNLALNELRRRERRDRQASPSEGPEPASRAPAVDDVVHARRESEIVQGALEALPDKQRAALLLSAVEGHSYAEIAEALDVSEKAVKALVHRARTGLATRLAQRGETP